MPHIMWLLGTVVALAASVGLAHGQPPQEFKVAPAAKDRPQAVRRIARAPGKRLLEEVQPADEILEIVDSQPDGLPPSRAEGFDPLDSFTADSSLIVEVLVRSQEGAMSPDGTYVNTIVTGNVQDVFKNTSRNSVRTGSLVEIVAPGGEVAINTRQIIRGYLRNAERIADGSTYVVFIKPDGTAHLSGWLRVDRNGSLEPLVPAGRALFGTPDKATFVTQVRRSAAKH